jgi:hypothetical protein
MRLETVLFGGKESYERLANVLRKSVERYSPNTPLTIRKRKRDTKIRVMGRQRAIEVQGNATKTKYHNEIVQEAKNGEVIGLLDCDLMVLRPLGSIEEEEFDIAVTYRPEGSKLLFNSGVVFVRISNRTKNLYAEWWEVAEAMLEDIEFFKRWRDPFGGINQTSLGYLLGKNRWRKLKILKLPCQEWNCENETWTMFAANTRIVHMLGDLRLAALDGRITGTFQMREIAKIWNRIEDRYEEILSNSSSR